MKIRRLENKNIDSLIHNIQIQLKHIDVTVDTNKLKKDNEKKSF